MVIRERVEEKIATPQDLVTVMEAILRAEHETDQMREHFWVIGADIQNYISYIELVSLGILNRALVHPREVFRLAIMKGVARIFCCHNHPSGCPDPSTEDNAVTDKLRNAGEILGIELLDHIIIGESRYYSYMEEGKLITSEEKGEKGK